MKCLSCLFVLLVAPVSADAASTFQRVTGSATNVGGFEFRITSTPPADDGSVAFLIQIVAKEARFSRKPATSLAVVNAAREPAPDAALRTVRGLNRNRRENTITLGFSVSEKSLKDQNLCFVFTNYVEVEINGKLVPAASADFFYIRLNDFVQRGPEPEGKSGGALR